jgi:PLP dependent protein
MPVGDIEKNLEIVKEKIAKACRRCGRKPEEIKLVAVTKTVSVGDIRQAYDLGIRDFGENRVQEAELKIAGLSFLKPGITWHMIGHLQSNKARVASRLFNVIESVDSIKLAEVLNQHASGFPVLLEVNVSGEESKSGLGEADLKSAFESIKTLPNIQVTGLMTVAPIAENPEEVRPVFRRLKVLADELNLKNLSMGMTDDYEVAIEEGATIIRLGRAIFGERRI